MYNDFARDVHKVTRKLIEVGLAVDQNFPSLQSNGRNRVVTWAGQTDISFLLKNIEYTEVYYRLNAEKNYNVKMVDGALLQMMYMFKGRELVSHRLAFYPAPHLMAYQEEPEIYNHQELYGDIVDKDVYPFPIRFDYDLNNYMDIRHPKSHVTFGQYKNCRIPVHSPLCPHQFADFIVRNFYSTDENYNVIFDRTDFRYMERTISDNEQRVLHFNCL